MAAIKVVPTNGGEALIDELDLDLFKSRNWHATRRATSSGRTYAYLATKKGRALFHRLVVGALPGQVVDHIDGNGLNNTRANLRVCSHAENMRNRKPNAGKTLPKGVRRRGAVYAAAIRCGEVRRSKSGFKTPSEASRCYEEWALELHGQFARVQ